MNLKKPHLNKKTGHEIRYECFGCSMAHNIPLYVNNVMVARIMVLQPDNTDWFILFDIQVHNEKDRGKGYGTEALDFAKKRFGKIQTGAKDEAAAKFLIKNGFKVKRSRVKGHEDIYFYLKEMEEDE